MSVTQNPKYLGVHLDITLTMKRLIDDAIIKTNIRGRKIYPYMQRFSFATKKFKLKLYKTYVRPVLAYAAPILTGQLKAISKNSKYVKTIVYES